MTRVPVRTTRTVSQPHDPAEREADRAADVVARGGTVAGWSFTSMPLTGSTPVHREEKKGAANPDDEKKKEALKKTGEAILETAPVKKLKEKVLEDPVVKKVKDAATSSAGLVVGGAAVVGAVTALGVAGKELPFQPPSIPLDVVKEGLSAKVTLTGPVNNPTEVGLTITYSPPGEKKKSGADRDAYRAETARLRADMEKLRPKDPSEEKLTEDAIRYVVAKQTAVGGLYLPLTPKTDAPKKDEAPAQRKAADPSTAAASRPAEVPAGGHPLDAATRRTMEARFGYDFSKVRIHDDTAAADAAAAVDASAFTIGTDVVFGAAGFDPSAPAGRHLLAHELAHVVQQTRAPAGGERPLQRRGADEWLGIFFGTTEGTWDDAELTTYLTKVTTDGKIEGAFDSDNKARAIVGRWVAGSATFRLTAAQKALLIAEMIDGPTLGEDEAAILDLLERSDAGDLVAMLGPGGVKLADLESNIDDENRTRLDRFVARRFEGGAEAVRAGRVKVVDGGAQPADAAQAVAAPAGPSLLDSLGERERKQIQVVTTSSVEIPGLDDKMSTAGGKTTLPLPSDTTVVLGTGLAGSPVEHGLRNVASALTTTSAFTKPPLHSNGTITIDLDLKKHGGASGLYQFTYVKPAAPVKKGEPGARILVDFLGSGVSPLRKGAKAGADPVAEKVKRHGFRHDYSGDELDALRAALALIPDAHLARVAGLRFARKGSHDEKPEVAGDYDHTAHVVTMYDRAFQTSQVRFATGAGTAASPATRAIVHEIGHAIDLQPIRAASQAKAGPDRDVAALPRDFPDPKDPKGFRWDTPEKKREIDRRLKAQRDAEQLLLKARSASGTKVVKKGQDFEDVVDKSAVTAYRTAAKKDSPKAVSKYGEEDWQEHYAEAYSLYITAPSTLKALRPNVFAHFEEALK